MSPKAASLDDHAHEMPDDSQLVDLVRSGHLASFEELYRRHYAVARYVARAESDNSDEAEDIAAEAFASVLKSLCAGGGPRESFQAYLTTTVRRTAYRRNLQGRRTATFRYGSMMDVLVLDEDVTIKAFETTILMRAFRTLPLRWRAVLWCVDVEGLKPAATARVMELSPNGVSALLIRAREGLRQAYLQEHVAESPNNSCTDFSRHLGKFVRNAVRKAARDRVARHVAACRSCAEALRHLEDIHSAMEGSSSRQDRRKAFG
ncbi:RNA polymerase sigma factor, sigma-70 family [Arthrobacter sp. yr096]|uniref:RNA polymerase sigma factor n=1 Tax=Arthrobacter sp. yr096 TaxID=1761750 RepID=UPI0008C4E9F5|nr:sigma-70 family RNA polymerase sigma factor [Arthrobacter sp. yr096]SEJ05619.1 RNA polymerase sigma factor, sigma-70 family [Arthrobacter sp. yr096]